MQNATAIQHIEAVYKTLSPLMDERVRRQWAAAEAKAYGWGGIQAVRIATGISVNTIRKGLAELSERDAEPSLEIRERVRREGGGRKRLTDLDPGLLAALEGLMEPATRGDPQSPLRWTCKSTTRLAQELTQKGHPVSASTVRRLLRTAGYSLQKTRKVKEGTQHPDRNAQFEYINDMVQDFQQRGQPAISVDTKKKELVGEFSNQGREWQPQGEPVEVLMHDFVNQDLGKAIPYGVYDLAHNQGWVSIGITHDTAQFATETIRRWWCKMGVDIYRYAHELLITADAGGSNGSHSRLWKVALQTLATSLGIPIQVCHFPPGTSKWNKIEHRMFCHITQNWRGRPLVSLEAILNLIAATSTQQGLIIRAELDLSIYPTGLKVTDDELACVRLKPADFHGDWNYRILPACHLI